jgi:hypothetical protein
MTEEFIIIQNQYEEKFNKEFTIIGLSDELLNSLISMMKQAIKNNKPITQEEEVAFFGLETDKDNNPLII